MKGKLAFLLRRIPWRLLVALFGGVLVLNGGTEVLSVEPAAESGALTQAAEQGMGWVVVGAVMLIAAIMVK